MDFFAPEKDYGAIQAFGQGGTTVNYYGKQINSFLEFIINTFDEAI